MNGKLLIRFQIIQTTSDTFIVTYFTILNSDKHNKLEKHISCQKGAARKVYTFRAAPRSCVN